MIQCETCDHWKPKKDYWSGEIRYYCELTGERSKEDWKKGKCSSYMMIKSQSPLQEFIE